VLQATLWVQFKLAYASYFTFYILHQGWVQLTDFKAFERTETISIHSHPLLFVPIIIKLLGIT